MAQEKISKKQLKAEAAAAAKEDAVREAIYNAKCERKKIEKTVVAMDKTVGDLMAKAADAKVKGYTDIYNNCISMIKVARARKKQSEMFIFQIDAMMTMRDLAQNSTSLLESMGTVMNSLGALSLDKGSMMNSQRDFMKIQSELDRQTATIESFLSGMEMNLPDSGLNVDDFSNATIEAEIDALINGSSAVGGGMSSFASSGSGSSGTGDTADLDYMKRLLKS